MNKGALRAALMLRLKMTAAGDSLLLTATLDDMIRHALNDISIEHDWPWLLNSASVTFDTTTGLAPVPTGFVRARHLMIGTSATSKRKGRYAELGEFLDIQADGSCHAWTATGASIALTPIPTAVPVATLWFQRQEPTLGSDAASPLIPEMYQDTVLARAAYHSEGRRGNPESAAGFDNEYQLTLKKMKVAAQAVSGPRRVVSARNNPATW